MSDVMAIGDGENDVALLAAAGVRCAMGNGSEALKERCVLSLRWCRPARACMRASWTCLAHLLTLCALSAPTTCWAPTMRREDGRSPLRWPCTPSRGWRAFRRALASARSSCKWQSTRATRAGSCLRPLRARVPGGLRAADARVRRRRERACPRRQRGTVRRQQRRVCESRADALVATREADRFEGRIRLRFGASSISRTKSNGTVAWRVTTFIPAYVWRTINDSAWCVVAASSGHARDAGVQRARKRARALNVDALVC